MRKQVILWIILILLIVSSLPSIMSRWHVEENNNIYEFAVPFQEIHDLTEDQEMTVDDALANLKKAGLHSVSIEPFSLQTLDKSEILSIVDQTTFENMALFIDENFQGHEEKSGFYITKPKDDYYSDVIKEHFNTKELMLNGQSLYFIQAEKDGPGRRSPIGYDQEMINQIKKHDLNIILRAENDTEDVNERILEHVTQLKSDPMISGFLFTGEEVLNFPQPQAIVQTGQLLNDTDFHTYSIEFTEQKGMQTLARSMNYNVIRLHSIDLDKSNLETNVERVIRAVKERNIRTVFFHIGKDNPEETLEEATKFISTVTDRMPTTFSSGNPELFENIQQPLWSLLLILLAGVVFTFIVIDTLDYRLVTYAAVTLLVLLIGGYFVLQKIIFLQAFALIISIITPTYAVLRTSLLKKKGQSIWSSYFMAIGISIVGILIMIGMLNGNGYITGFELFRGVKLVYTVPLLITLFVIFKDYTWGENKQRTKSFLNMPIKYWHAILLMIVSSILVYYMMRTGNAGTASNLELTIRQLLEEVLYVRPRTKEFLIGFPLFLLALHRLQKGDVWGKVLLIPGSIGFLSMINTFSHLHIPLSVSALRTVYSIGLGFIFGLLLIYIYDVLYRVALTKREKR